MMSSCLTRTLRIFSRSAVRIEFSHPGSRLAGQLKPLHPIVIEGVASMLQVGGGYE